MNRKHTLRSLFSVLALAGAVTANAQSTTQGAIAGTVEDATAAVIPNATVTIHNNGTNADTKLLSDGSGYFKAPLLEPGTYTVTVAASGFGGYSAAKVIVEVGKLTTVSPHLTAGSTEQVVQVSADQPLLNFESADASTVLNRTAVDNVPVFTKRWSALALLTPGVTVDSSGYGLVQVRGISPLLNNVEIDGADDNQAYFSEERGRTREGYSTSSYAVREFEVNTGVYPAQFGRAAGGVINSVTRSGTNNLHGELFFTDLDRGFGAYQPGNVDAFGNPLKPKDLRKIYGGSIGGPLMKDKLFFFYTFDKYAHINPGIAKVNNYGSADGSTVGSVQERPDAALATGAACNLTTGAYTNGSGTSHNTLDGQVCLYAARTNQSYATAVTAYNAGVQSLLTDFGIVPRVGYQVINTPKLDFQINSKNRLSLVYHRLRWDSPGGVQTSSTANYSVDAFGNDFVKLDYGVAKLTTTLGSRLNNEILYQYGRELNDESQQPYSAYTLANLQCNGCAAPAGAKLNGPNGTIPYVSLSTGLGSQAAIGSPYYSYRTAYPDERKWQIEDTLYYSIGSHSIKIGADFVHNSDFVNQTPYYYGYYSYSNLSQYFSDLYSRQNNLSGQCGTTGTGVGAGVGCFSSVTQEFGAQTTFAIATLDSAGFIQDNWKVTPRLSLELGLRYDYEALPAPISAFTSAVGTFTPYAGIANQPSDKNNFGPRIGFSYDLLGNGSTVLRGGYGLYYGRIINATIGSVYSQTGSPNAQTYVSGTKPTAVPGLTFPHPESAGSVKPSSYFLAPNLQNPQVHEFDLQLQRDLGRGNVFQISYLGALGRELPNFLDVNLAPPQTNVTVTVGNPTITNGSSTGPLAVGSTFTIPQFATCTAGSTGCTNPTGYLNTNFGDITEVFSNVNSSYHALVVEIQNRSWHGVQYDANYTWSHALDFNQNASAGTSTNSWLNPYGNPRANYGNSAFNVGNRFSGYVLYNFPKTHFSQGWLNAIASGWMANDSFQMQNGLPYSATISSSNYISSTALKSGTINGVSSVTFIPQIGLNKFQVPRVIVDDFRLQKSFLIREKYDLQFNADLYNVANHENYSPGASGDISTTAYSVASGATATSSTIQFIPQPQGNRFTGFQSHSAANNSNFSYIPREIQFGARLQF